MTDKTERVTRSAIEQMLHEMAGFNADATDIAAAMVVIDTYVADQAFLMGGTSPLIESHLHLLMQQAELLLDSASSAARLRSDISELQQIILRTTASLEAAVTAASLPDPVIELTDAQREEVSQWEADLRTERAFEFYAEPVNQEPAGPARKRKTKPKPELEPVPQWEADLLAEQARGIREDPAMGTQVFCRHCGEWKAATPGNFFRNSKSQTGWESKCKACRPPRKSAA